ncbi:MAG: OmpA family protein, partial [Bacteroidota bacterium]
NGRCDKKERLAELGPVKHSDWRLYETKLNPRRNYNYLIIEVYYKTPTLMPYNGNILIDKASAIIPCDEEFIEEPALAVNEERENVNVPPSRPDKPVVKKDPPSRPKENTPTETVFIPELKEKNNLSEGQIIRLENVNFEADSSRIVGLSAKVLDELGNFLKRNKSVSLEIGGHTNSYPPKDYCDRLSSNRANSVRDYLIAKGVSSNRLTAVGYGKEQPIADNNTLEGRRRNQRVEIKILNIK